MSDFLERLKALNVFGETEKTAPSLTKPTLSQADKVFTPQDLAGPKSAVELTPVGDDSVNDGTSVLAKESKGGMTNVQKALALDVGGTALQTFGALKNIKAKEQDALDQIAQQYNIAKEDLDANVNIRAIARSAQRTRDLVARIRGVQRQGTASSVQRQQFISDPSTGALI